MDYTQALEKMFKDGVDSLWRSVEAMPEDKLIWKPAPEARTARALLEELAMTTAFSTALLRSKKVPDMGSGEGNAEEKPEKTLEELEKEHRANVNEFMEAVKEFPVAELSETIDLPWGTMSFFQCVTYPYWNLMYHWGQINYIQTMYGDKEMH